MWEGSKALFAIPRYMLPHIHEVFGEFLREGADGTPVAELARVGPSSAVSGDR